MIIIIVQVGSDIPNPSQPKLTRKVVALAIVATVIHHFMTLIYLFIF
jgi:predicted secreted protein